MNKYENPKFNVIVVASEDVLTASPFLEPFKDGYINNNNEYNVLDRFVI